MLSCCAAQYSGVFEAVQIRKSGFPFRWTHKQFFWRFKCVMPRETKFTQSMVENDKKLIAFMKQNTEEVQIGTSRVLYRAKQHRQMELIRNVAVEKVVLFLQRVIRGFLARLLLGRMKKVRSSQRVVTRFAFD